jgi:hypothetical protein
LIFSAFQRTFRSVNPATVTPEQPVIPSSSPCRLPAPSRTTRSGRPDSLRKVTRSVRSSKYRGM